MASVRFENVSKLFDKKVVAVEQFSLEIRDKEFVVLVGPSGCGKSTTLRMIAGLETPSTGNIYIGGQLVNDIRPKDRDIAMVFQNYALYPHMTVYENIAYGLRLRHFPKKVIDEKVREAARSLAITELLDRKPKALSGGQRQRVAIGRAIVREPKVFLMDEPLSNLDAKLRNQMRAEIMLLRKRIDTTFVYVTHDQVEAMTLGDRIVIMKDGVIQQVGTPQEVFSRPANQFVGGFIGTPQMNFFDGELLLEDGVYSARLGDRKVALSAEKQQRLRESGVGAQKIVLGIRPEHIALGDEGIPAVMGVSEMMGSSIHLHLSALGQDVVVVVSGMDDTGHFVNNIPEGTGTHILIHENALHLFDGETGRNLEYPKEQFVPGQLPPMEAGEGEETPAAPAEAPKSASETPAPDALDDSVREILGNVAPEEGETPAENPEESEKTSAKPGKKRHSLFRFRKK